MTVERQMQITFKKTQFKEITWANYSIYILYFDSLKQVGFSNYILTEFQCTMRYLTSNGQGCRDGRSGLSHPVHVWLSNPLFSPLPHSEDPCRLVPGALKELVESALQAMLIFFPFTQGENARSGISRKGSTVAHSARAAQQHIEATGTRGLSAALRHVVSTTSQLRQQQYQHQHQDFLLGEITLCQIKALHNWI